GLVVAVPAADHGGVTINGHGAAEAAAECLVVGRRVEDRLQVPGGTAAAVDPGATEVGTVGAAIRGVGGFGADHQQVARYRDGITKAVGAARVRRGHQCLQ